MDATFRVNHKTKVYLSCIGYYISEHTKSRNMEATFRRNILTIVHSTPHSCNGYYVSEQCLVNMLGPEYERHFKRKSWKYSLPQLSWSLYVLSKQGPEIGKQLLDENLKL